MREPNESELRYLVYTTLAYGAQGISYYVYSHPGHTPGIATAEAQPTAVYEWLAPLNRDFLAIASQIQPLRSLGVHHAGMLPPGAEPLPDGAAFRLEPPVEAVPFRAGERVRGVLVGTFGPAPGGPATHAMVVNLDYRDGLEISVQADGPLDRFDTAANRWNPSPDPPGPVQLAPGGGLLVRIRP
jgi:hypothetical protein